MRLVLVGRKKELLSSLVPENRAIKTLIFSSTIDIDCPANSVKELVLVDLDNIESTPQEAYSKISARPTSPTIWAYYSQNNCPVQKKLLDMGFDKVFSYEDNVVKAIQDFAQNT